VLGRESSPFVNVLAAAASLTGIVVLALAVSRRDRRLWCTALVIGIALVGFLAGSVLSAVALILWVRSERRPRAAGERRAMSVTSILRASSPPLIHLGVALVILGYAASAYSATQAQVTARTDAVTESFSGYQYRLAGSRGLDENSDGLYETVTAQVSVARGGILQFVVEISLVWQTQGVSSPRYVPEASVRSLPTADLAFTFLGFSDGNRTYAVNDQPSSKATSDSLTVAVFQVKESPLMVPLWGGGWLMATGMGIRIWSERGLVVYERPVERGAGRRRTGPTPGPRMEADYRRLLRAEVEREDWE